jgi:hypothetical protein
MFIAFLGDPWAFVVNNHCSAKQGLGGSEGALRILLVPADGGRPFVMTLPMTLVGSKEGCDFRVEGEGVAPLCCVLALTDGIVLLRDLDTDSIRVNGQCVRRAMLLANDLLTIAGCEFRVHYEEGAA